MMSEVLDQYVIGRDEFLMIQDALICYHSNLNERMHEVENIYDGLQCSFYPKEYRTSLRDINAVTDECNAPENENAVRIV